MKMAKKHLGKATKRLLPQKSRKRRIRTGARTVLGMMP